MARNPYDYYITDGEYELAASNGINSRTLDSRIRDLGWSKQKALTTPVQKRSKYPTEILNLIDESGLDMPTFHARIRRGWDTVKAATTPKIDGSEKIQFAIDARRKYTDEILKLAKSNGIKYGTFVSRVSQLGWDVFKAASTPSMSKEESCRLARTKSTFRLGIESFWNMKKATPSSKVKN